MFFDEMNSIGFGPITRIARWDRLTGTTWTIAARPPESANETGLGRVAYGNAAGSLDPKKVFVWDVGSDPLPVSINDVRLPLITDVETGSTSADGALSADGETFMFLATQTSPAQLITLSMPSYPNKAAIVRPDETYCMPAIGAGRGDYVTANITPVVATARGNGALHSSDDPGPSTATVNFGPGTVDPNVALVKVGTDGKICFTNSEHANVNIILDQLVNATSTSFSLPTAEGAVRLTDTRVARA